MKKTVRILALLLVACLLTGCGASTRTYTCGELTMNVPSVMKDVSSESDFGAFTFALDSTNVAIFGLNETFAEYPVLEEFDTKGYAEQVVLLYSLDTDICQRFSSNYHYFVYTADTEQGEFTYMAGIYKTESGFWMIQIAAPSGKYDEQDCFAYLDSVAFN